MDAKPGPRHRRDDPNTADIGSARLSPRTDKDAEPGDVLSGGDASRAPQSLRERGEGASSARRPARPGTTPTSSDAQSVRGSRSGSTRISRGIPAGATWLSAR
ncbi:hypothetical protein GCM10025865_27090 [Paraoerskovia sediminicola]|uniref:Uncharacterized protein n=1 Tax=Paraoerskovia sediminicola TaxID=1138587 RepID=A0ABM8G5M3_9CELL|nr:hypothetical protein GCM10025865_27090 [Paraoerskovia sediminicola]